MDNEQTLEQAGAEAHKPNGAAIRQPIRPPALNRAREPYLSVEIAPELISDGTPALEVAAGAVALARTTWEAIATHYIEARAKIGPFATEAAQLVKSRAFSYAAKQAALKRADASLAELRVASRELEATIERKTAMKIAPADAAAAIERMEVRTWLRSLPDRQRAVTVERAIASDDATIATAALSSPTVAGLAPAAAGLYHASWRRKRAPAEVERLEVLAKASEAILQAATRLEARYSESFDHGALDRIEAQQKAA